MFDGYIYGINPKSDTATVAFDYETIQPHVETSVRGGMAQIMVMPESGDRLIFSLFEAGQIGMLDTTDRQNLK